MRPEGRRLLPFVPMVGTPEVLMRRVAFCPVPPVFVRFAFWLTLAVVFVASFASGDRSALAAVVDGRPPQLAVDFIFPPSPLYQYHSTHLVYEMRLMNYSSETAYEVEALNVVAGPRVFHYAGNDLAVLFHVLGGPPAPATIIRPGSAAIVYLTLDFPNASDVPTFLRHAMKIGYPDGRTYILGDQILPVSSQPPTVVSAPVDGPHWIALDASHNGLDAVHRRSIDVENGQAWIAQRYAIDWLQYRLDGKVGVTYSGDEFKNSSYFCFDAPVHSVAPGTVVDVRNDLPNNTPHTFPYIDDLSFGTTAGNHVVVDIGNGLYVLYAHLDKDSLEVGLGQHVHVGQVLGRIGNSGDSTEPHLHMHVVNGPSFIGAQGVPFAFAQFAATGSLTLVTHPNSERITFTGFTPLESFAGDYPANDAAVAF